MKVSGNSVSFSIPGDSGAAVLGTIMGGIVWSNYTYNHSIHARILGLNFASDSNNNSYFSPINSIIQEFGPISNE